MFTSIRNPYVANIIMKLVLVYEDYKIFLSVVPNILYLVHGKKISVVKYDHINVHLKSKHQTFSKF